jgi:aflatoxin B1 aldehyde reductase
MYDPSTVHSKILKEQYGKPSYLKFLEEYGRLVAEAGSTKVGMPYRWIVWNSALDARKGDCIVLGASSVRQLKETCEQIEKGPLEGWVVERLEEMWKEIEADAPGDNFAVYKKLLDAGLL